MTQIEWLEKIKFEVGYERGNYVSYDIDIAQQTNGQLTHDHRIGYRKSSDSKMFIGFAETPEKALDILLARINLYQVENKQG